MAIEQAVIVEFKYGLSNLEALFDLEEKLHQAIETADVGEYDGNAVATDLSDGTLYMYGPSAAPFMRGALCTRRYGDAGDLDVREVRTVI